ncbi:hypothetical protein CN277_11135 [Bacillus cereus]|uniref:GNAT family N-acetyltransferase n=1 Tax=Bacillus cereus TaxID=1396 RepID=UPI000BECE73A|nr:GNAT family N-acetyltransferase [Bacillus cereus]PEE56853.1 hypothetical protein COM68_22220 [Bacillus cereus]PFC62512.1 hypothetical protein CN267_08605 [Bacillus cereus]PFD02796.1 hypothetical protein CN277_11135 [Bacillus cereus]
MTEINKDLIEYAPIIDVVKDRPELVELTESFESENPLIDTWIKNLYFAHDHHRLGLVSTTLIMYGDKPVGFYAARVGSLEVEDEGEKKLLKNENNIPAVEITHFAIHKDYAGKGIGTDALDVLRTDLIEINNYAAIRYLFCWAAKKEETLYFYEQKNGFIRMEREKDDTVLMRFPIPDTKDVLDISEMRDDFPI